VSSARPLKPRQHCGNKALAVGISSLDELRESVAWLEKEESIRQRQAASAIAFNDARSRNEEARQALETVRAEARGADSLELVRWKLAEAAKHRDVVHAQWRDAEADLRELRDAEREYREIQRAIADQQKLCDRVRAEQRALQSQDSAAAARKLHRLMLERLLDRANSHLEVLSGRYALRQLQTKASDWRSRTLSRQGTAAR